MPQYDVILSDPPWYYGDRKPQPNGKWKTNCRSYFGGGTSRRYPTMKDDEILALAPWVHSISAENSALFLWATCPRLDFALEFLRACGFRYSTVAFSWTKLDKKGKPIAGPGYYTGSNLELVLLGVKGSMKPALSLTPSVIFHKRMEHIRKPDEVRKRIEIMYPEARRLEMFARPVHPLWPKTPGWDTWGSEIQSDIAIS